MWGLFEQLSWPLESAVAVDSRKVYVTGYSLGAFMANRIGVEASDMVAAVAPVAGELWQSTGGTIPTEKAPVSVLMLHGDADTSVPYCGMSSPYPEATEDDTFNYSADAESLQGEHRNPVLRRGALDQLEAGHGLLNRSRSSAIQADRRNSQVVYGQFERSAGNIHSTLQFEF